jgi:hypothetical protein
VLLWLHLSCLASHVFFIVTRPSHRRSTMSSAAARASRRLRQRARVPCASSRRWTGFPLMLCCQIVQVSCGQGRMEIGSPLFAPLELKACQCVHSSSDSSTINRDKHDCIFHLLSTTTCYYFRNMVVEKTRGLYLNTE